MTSKSLILKTKLMVTRNMGNFLPVYGIAQIPLGSSRHVSTPLDTFDVSSRAIPTWRTTNKL